MTRGGIALDQAVSAVIGLRRMALAQKLAAGPTQAYGRIKALLGASLSNTLSAQLDAERDAFHASTRTADFSEGVSAFLEKRPTRFTGQ